VKRGSIFFEKKKQKTFVTWSTPISDGETPGDKVFLLLFVHKKMLPASPLGGNSHDVIGVWQQCSTFARWVLIEF